MELSNKADRQDSVNIATTGRVDFVGAQLMVSRREGRAEGERERGKGRQNDSKTAVRNVKRESRSRKRHALSPKRSTQT